METKTKEFQEIEIRMKKEKDRRMFERYQTLYLHFHGLNNEQIAMIIGRCTKTVSQYLKAYRNHGLQGLEMKFSPGAPERLSKVQQEQIKETIVNCLPHEVGFTAKHNWTLHLIGQWIQREFGHTYSLRGISKMVHRLGLSYTKPTYTLAAADESRQKHFTETTFPELKKS